MFESEGSRALLAFHCHDAQQVSIDGLLLKRKKRRDVVLPSRYAEALKIGKASPESSALTTSGVPIVCDGRVSKRTHNYEAYVATRSRTARIIIGLVPLDLDLTALGVNGRKFGAFVGALTATVPTRRTRFFFQFVERST
jgi:hypothetical protein